MAGFRPNIGDAGVFFDWNKDLTGKNNRARSGDGSMTHEVDSSFNASAGMLAGLMQIRWRRHAFAALAAFILLAPAPGQLFDQHSPWLREWIMYSGVGVGIPKGVFVVHDETGGAAELTPLAAAGLERFPRIPHYFFEGRVFEPAHLARFAASLCADLPVGQRVSFTGDVGTRHGWTAMPVEDVCNGDVR